MRLIQVCNVGNVVGGTAACAWSVTRAMPDVEHTVVFRSQPGKETRAAFSHCQIEVAKKIEPGLLEKWGGDFLILHNVSAENLYWKQKLPELKMPVLQYAHSAIRQHAGADLTVACSLFLAQKMGQRDMQVVYQGVPCLNDAIEKQGWQAARELVVGRICTPCPQKWPGWLVPFYQRLAERFPRIRWEFVGCPISMRSEFLRACHQQVVFHDANWKARKYMNRWHVLLYHNRDVTETFGRTVAEAMLAGCVPIVDCAGGFCEQVSSENGFLCADSSEFMEALKEVSCWEEWERRSKCCRELAGDLFSLSAFRQRLLSACLATVEKYASRAKVAASRG